MRGAALPLKVFLALLYLLAVAQPAEAAYEGMSPGHRDPRPAVAATSIRVPVLMYHHVSNVPRDADSLRRDLTVTPASFRAQLVWLRDHGYTTVTAEDLWGALVEGRRLPEHPVVLTFDDGYDDNYHVAFPLLHEFGATGVFFLVVNLLGRGGYLTRDEARAMADAGMDIESHGMDHVNHARLTPDQQRLAFCGSRAILTMVAGRPVRFFAFPNGNAPAAADAMAECEYHGAFLKAGGALQDRSAPFALHRTRVPGGSGAAALPQLLSR